MYKTKKSYLVLACLTILLGAPTAHAESKINALEGQPAVRHRVELRKGRFEIGPVIQFTLNRLVRDSALFGIKAEYHILDSLSVGLEIAGGPSFGNALSVEMWESYVDEGTDDLEGAALDAHHAKGLLTWKEHAARMSNIHMAGDIRVTWTPIYGRIAFFSNLFVLYDMYIFGGFGMAYIKNNFDANSSDPYDDFRNGDGVDATNEGFRPGLTLPGIGVHIYINNWIAIGLEVKNIMFEDNETGGDLTRGLTDTEREKFAACGNQINYAAGSICMPSVIDSDDREFITHWFLGLNLTFFLPTVPDISR